MLKMVEEGDRGQNDIVVYGANDYSIVDCIVWTHAWWQLYGIILAYRRVDKKKSTCEWSRNPSSSKSSSRGPVGAPILFRRLR